MRVVFLDDDDGLHSWSGGLTVLGRRRSRRKEKPRGNVCHRMKKKHKDPTPAQRETLNNAQMKHRVRIRKRGKLITQSKMIKARFITNIDRGRMAALCKITFISCD
jgi:hypothetical protein